MSAGDGRGMFGMSAAVHSGRADAKLAILRVFRL